MRLEDILRNAPIRGNQDGWNCVEWVKEALSILTEDRKCLGTRVTDWQLVRDTAMNYVQPKKEHHRFDGKGNFDTSKVATYDLISKKEVHP